jgi:hypothetical protein
VLGQFSLLAKGQKKESVSWNETDSFQKRFVKPKDYLVSLAGVSVVLPCLLLQQAFFSPDGAHDLDFSSPQALSFLCFLLFLSALAGLSSLDPL